MVDARITNAPSSTKSKQKQRDPDRHQTRKGKQRYFGMKACIGVDSKTKIIHSVVAMAAHVHDAVVIEELLQGQETRVWGDSAYTGKKEKMCEVAPQSKDFTHAKGSRYRRLTQRDKEKNRSKSKVRAKVEHVFGVMKCQFGFSKPRYKELDKNAHHPLYSLRLN